jgi:type IV pilus assembly protein PilA
MNKLIKNSEQGFTLVELLVVIGVLGVLAAAVLTAINPLEQLARGRDGGRKSTVSQLGNALQAYYTSQNATYPTANATWITTLINSGEVKTVPSAVTPTPYTCVTNSQNGWCYNIVGAEAVVFTRAESSSEATRAGCTGTQVAWIAWTSIAGKTGTTCTASNTTIPTPSSVLN